MGRVHGRAGQGWHVIRKTASVVAVAMLLAGAAHAAENAKQVDAELLEFLGSIDAEEEGWQEYLEQKPVKAAADKPAKDAAPARAPEPKQVKQQ
jgi:hypothetical protein